MTEPCGSAECGDNAAGSKLQDAVIRMKLKKDSSFKNLLSKLLRSSLDAQYCAQYNL